MISWENKQSKQTTEEPWDQHENLDPLAFSSFSTSAGTEQQSVYYDANGNLQYKNDPNTSGAQ